MIGNIFFSLSPSLTYPTHRYVLYVEVAATGLCGAGEGGLINPPDPNLHYPLSTVEIAVFNQDAYDLLMDLTVIIDMAKVQIWLITIQ